MKYQNIAYKQHFFNDCDPWRIARRILAIERTYTANHIKSKLEFYFDFSAQNSQELFIRMVDNGVLLSTGGEPCEYYLSNSTPF